MYYYFDEWPLISIQFKMNDCERMNESSRSESVYIRECSGQDTTEGMQSPIFHLLHPVPPFCIRLGESGISCKWRIGD
jgi:hypothetical protein